MLPPRTRWNLSEADENLALQLSGECGIHPLAARLMVLRGFRRASEVNRFFRADLGDLHDPFLLDGIEAAVERIRLALARKEKIRIYGDYDADGVSSTALMVRLMRRLKACFDYYVPHRSREGYGLNRTALEDAKRNGISLIITVDNGISAREEAAYAAQLGMDLVITDHHEPPEQLPDAACAVMNPKKPGCPYPFKHLAGVGVAFKLAHALLGEMPEEWLELVALGTIADLMPLTDENRIFVQAGLKRMTRTSIPGLKALFDISGADAARITETTVGFAVAPRINAGGRMSHAAPAVRLLSTDDEREAEALARELDQLNKERQKQVDEITSEAFALMEQSGWSEDRVVVVAGEDWNVGVVGIVASKILEKKHRPVIVLSVDSETGQAKGSARSIEGFDIHKALTACQDCLEHYGGHSAAGGMTLQSERIPEFRARLNDLAAKWLSSDDLVPQVFADLACSLEDVDLNVIEEIRKMSPFGSGNPSPRFVFKDLDVRQVRTMGKGDRHLKLVLAPSGGKAGPGTEAVLFGKGYLGEWISPRTRMHVYGEVSVNEWNGMRKPQVMAEDIWIPDPQVFDWRGTGDICTRIRKWWEARASLEQDQLPAVIVGDPDFDVPEGMFRLSYGDAVKRSGSLAAASDLILYAIPPDANALAETIRAFPRLRRIYAAFAGLESFSAEVPSRDSFKNVYVRLRKDRQWPANDERVLRGISRKAGISEQTIRFILDVFEELNLVEQKAGFYQVVPSPDKQDLSRSKRYSGRKALHELENRLLYSSGEELAAWLLSQLNSSGERREDDGPLMSAEALQNA